MKQLTILCLLFNLAACKGMNSYETCAFVTSYCSDPMETECSEKESNLERFRADISSGRLKCIDGKWYMELKEQ